MGQVNVLTRRPKDWNSTLTIATEGSSWEHKGTFNGKLNKVRRVGLQGGGAMDHCKDCLMIWLPGAPQVSADASEVVPGSEYVIIAAPANAHPDLLKASGSSRHIEKA